MSSFLFTSKIKYGIFYGGINMKEKRAFADLKNGEKLARQQAIINAAERVFAVKPFNKVSIRDIARETGISHAAIYRYFPDQRSLFIEAFLRGADEITSFLKDIVGDSKKGDIKKVTETYLDYLIENDQYFRMMTHFMLDGSLTKEMIEKLNAAERRIFDQFDIMFRKMDKPEPVRSLSHAFFAALHGILITFKNYPGRDQDAVRKHIKKISAVITGKFMA
jgi:AcrR family transcriptional regulator